MKQSIDLDRVVKHLEGRADLAAAYLFGSFARERTRPDSDVDIAVLFTKGEQDLMARFERCLEMEIGLQDLVRRTVQVVDLEESSLRLQRQVRKYGRLLVERDAGRRVAFEVASRRLFFDMEGVRRLRQAAASHQDLAPGQPFERVVCARADRGRATVLMTLVLDCSVHLTSCFENENDPYAVSVPDQLLDFRVAP